jgi:hypothetical protein
LGSRAAAATTVVDVNDPETAEASSDVHDDVHVHDV